MKTDAYKKLFDLYKKTILADLKALEKVKFPDFYSLPINCSDLNDHYQNELLLSLAENGVTDKSRILYYFTVEQGDPKTIQSTVKARKKRYKLKHKLYLALPRVNTLKEKELSNILYIGKTNSNFISRFKQHLGITSSSSYALHLKGWAESLDLKVTLNYGILNFSADDVRLLEQIETVLHVNKPLLGRSGH